MTDFATARVAMVDTQVRPSDVTRISVIQSMLAVPREEYVPAEKRPIAYLGEHMLLAPGRVMLDPRVFAKMLDALDLQPGQRVLDIGCGLGYSTAVMARIAGSVVGLEENPDLAQDAASRLAAQGVGNAAVEQGRLAAGLPQHAAFDAIILQGGIETIPDTLTEQLAMGGRIIAIFTEGQAGQVRMGLRGVNGTSWRRIFDATAPLLPGFARSKAFEF